VIESLYNAIFLGSIYALFALGFTLVFSVLDILNLAHPAIFGLGAFVALFAMETLGLPWPAAILLAFVMCGLVGIALDRIAFAPLRARSAPPLAAMISSIGASLILVRLLELRYGTDYLSYPAGSLPAVVVRVGDATFDGVRLLIIALGLLLMVGLTYLVRATRLGRELRALAENPRAARLLGVDVDRAIAATFFLSAGLGGVGGALLGFAYNSVVPQMGSQLELRAFTVMILGGMGSIPGAVVAAYLLGLGEVFSSLVSSELRDAFVFGTLFLVLVVRPNGLFGRGAVERV
jgi:branched-chain amino acid transport system permease protein